MEPTQKKSRTKTIILAVAIVLAIVIAVTVSILVIGNSPSRRLSEQLDLGNRYLSELDYEQAVAAYEAALEIDPKSSDAHLGLIRAYIALGDEEGLQNALRRAEDALDKDAYAALQTAAEGLRGPSAGAQEPPPGDENPGAIISWTDQSGEKSAFLDRIRQEEGVASENEFQTMHGTEWLPFPGDVYGYVSSAFVDLDGDGTQEAVILRTASDGIFVDVYKEKDGGYEKAFSSKISEFDPSSAQIIYLFRNPSGVGYFIFADRLSTGTHTRVTSVSADLFALTADAVTPSLHCEWVSIVNTADEFSHIAETLKGAGVPYAVYAADHDNRSAGDDFTILCNIQLRSEDAPSFDDLKLFLKITADASVTPPTDIAATVQTPPGIPELSEEMMHSLERTAYALYEAMGNSDNGYLSQEQIRDRLENGTDPHGFWGDTNMEEFLFWIYWTEESVFLEAPPKKYEDTSADSWTQFIERPATDTSKTLQNLFRVTYDYAKLPSTREPFDCGVMFSGGSILHYTVGIGWELHPWLDSVQTNDTTADIYYSVKVGGYDLEGNVVLHLKGANNDFGFEIDGVTITRLTN